MTKRKEIIIAGMEHLSKSDKKLRKIINAVGPFEVKLNKNRFGMLARSVVSQQLSTKVAKTINAQLNDLVDQNLSPESIHLLTIKKIRSAGLSERKAECIKSLASLIIQGEIPLKTIGRLDNHEIISKLTTVKGIGEWTVQMFLIFSLGRFDVLPYGDLGVRSAIQKIYGLEELPNKETVFEIAENWHPYSAMASWYCWEYHDLNL